MSSDLDEAYARSGDGSPFSNGHEGESWEASWCDRCQRDKAFRAGRSNTGCPLLLVAMSGRTPAEWIEQPRGENGLTSLTDRYHCTEFRGPGWRNPEPQPQPEPQGMDGLFQRPERRVRMLTQPCAVPAEARRSVRTAEPVGGVL